MSQPGDKPPSTRYRTSVAPSRRAAAAVAELVTRVTAAFRTVSRLRLCSFSMEDLVTRVLSASVGELRPK